MADLNQMLRDLKNEDARRQQEKEGTQSKGIGDQQGQQGAIDPTRGATGSNSRLGGPTDPPTKTPPSNGPQTTPQGPDPVNYGSDQARRAAVGNFVQAQDGTIANQNLRGPEPAQGVWGAEISGRDWVSESGSSIMRGLGDFVIGGTGDMFQVVGAGLNLNTMYEGNGISRWLQEAGQNMAENNKTYIPPELENPEFSLKTFANPQFWSKQAAQYVPQLVEFIMLGAGAGSLTKAALSRAGRSMAKRGLLKGGRGTLKQFSKKAATGADDVSEIAGVGRGMFTDIGKLTQAAGGMASNVGAGVANNVAAGLMNAAEAYNTRKEMGGFTEEELADIAGKTFANNLLYLPVDILSWGMTWGNGAKVMKQAGILKNTSKAISSQQSLKNLSKAFTARTSPILRKMGEMTGKALREGFEETYQETYETWAAKWAESQVMGTELESFWEFYNSEENEGTKTIAFALGALGGGAAGAIGSLNKDAERSAQLYNRTENLRTMFDATDEEGNKMREYWRRETAMDIVMNNKPEMVQDFTEHQVKQGLMNEEEAQAFKDTVQEFQDIYDQSTMLNVRGKYALMREHAIETYWAGEIDKINSEHNEVVELLKNSSLTDKQLEMAIAEKEAIRDETIKGLEYGMAQAQANKANLILGKSIEQAVEPVVVLDHKGKAYQAVGLKDFERKYFVEDTDADILKKNNRAYVAKSNAEFKAGELAERAKQSEIVKKLGELGNKAKAIYQQFKERYEGQPGDGPPADGGPTEEGNNEPDTVEPISDDKAREGGQDADLGDDTGTGPGEAGKGRPNVPPVVQGKKQEGKAELTDKEGNVVGETDWEVPEDLSEEDMERAFQLQDEIESAERESPKGKKAQKTVSDRIAAARKELEGLVKKARKEVSKIKLPEGLDRKAYDDVVAKLKGKKKLSPKEQKVYDGFKETFDRAVSSTKQFQEFVNKQTRQSALEETAGKVGEEVGKAAKKTMDRISKAIDDFKKSGNIRGMESRVDEDAPVDLDSGQDAPPVEGEDRPQGDPMQALLENKKEQKALLEDPALKSTWARRITTSPLDIDKMKAVNRRLAQLFPNADRRVNAYILDNLTKAIGIQGAGYAIGSTTFIRSNEWDQGEIFMHEMTHIFYGFAKDEPITKAVLEKVKKNTGLISEIRGKYPDHIIYIGTDEHGNTFQTTIDNPPRDKNVLAKILQEHGLEEAPLDQQEYILEEAFVAYMQGKLSKKYNSHFGFGVPEAIRQRSTRKWWHMISSRAKMSDTYVEENRELLAKLEEKDPSKVDWTGENMRDYIIKRFLENVPPLQAREMGFESRGNTYRANRISGPKLRIKKELEKGLNEYEPDQNRNIFKRKQDAVEDIMDMAANDGEAFEPISVMEKDFNARKAAATHILNTFIRDYNKAIRLKKLMWGGLESLFDKRDFLYSVENLAENSDNSIAFIDAIENSPRDDMKAFSKFMDLRTKGQRPVYLQSMWTILHNREHVSAHKNVMIRNQDGTVTHSQQTALSMTEQSRVQNVMDRMARSRKMVIEKVPNLMGEDWKKFEENMAKVYNLVNNVPNAPLPGPDTFIDIYKYLSSSGVKINEILASGEVNVGGKYRSPETVLMSFVKNNRHLEIRKKKLSPQERSDMKNRRRWIKQENGFDHFYGNFIDPYRMKPFIEAIVATNREYTPDTIVENVNGNMVPSVIASNHLTTEVKAMYADLQPGPNGNVMSKADFIKKYSHITGSKTYNKSDAEGNLLGNQFLDFYYDSVMSGTRPGISYYTGINDLVSNNTNEFDESTSYEQSFEDFMTYMNQPSAKTYMANVGVFGDSPRKFYMPVRKLDMSSATTRSMYNIYRNITKNPVSKTAFDKMLEAERQAEREFFRSNAENLSKIRGLENMFKKNAKGKWEITPEGTKTINGYVYNDIANFYFLSEVMSPNIDVSNVPKRLKNAASPIIKVNPNLSFEPIFFKDPTTDGLLNPEAATDGGMFILRRDADRWANAGKGVFDMGNSFKFLNFSVEKENGKFKGQTILLKGLTSVIDEAYVEANPRFRGLYEHMVRQSDRYWADYAKRNNGAQPSMNFADGMPNAFPIAIPYSAEKTKLKDNAGMEKAPSLDELNTPEGQKSAETFQDGLFWNRNGSFQGLSAYNFGPQQVFDKRTKQVTLPVQLVNSLLVASDITGNKVEVERIMSLISDQMESELDGILAQIKKKDVDSYRQLLLPEMDQEAMDQVQRFVINEYGITHPRAVGIVSNQLANLIKIKGNKLRSAGTYAHQKSSWGWELPVDGQVNGSRSLNGYTENANGGLNKAEIILPAHAVEEGVESRKYYTQDSELGKLAVKVTDEKGFIDTSKTPVENDLIRLRNAATLYADRTGRAMHAVMKDGKEVGYYVEGMTVIATRVPSNGPNFTGVFEVVDFVTDGGNMVQTSASFSDLIGGDLDGDALFIQWPKRGRENKRMNQVIESIAKLWMSPEMKPYVNTGMDTTNDGNALKAHVEETFPEYSMDRSLAGSPRYRRKVYEDSMIAKRNIGTVFNLHRLANILAAYNINMTQAVSIDSQDSHQMFSDQGTGKDSRNYKSALVANLILDNLNENATDALNINEHTVSAFTLLVNLNVPMKKIANIMNMPMIKEYVAIMNENNSAYHGYTPRAEMMNELAKRSVPSRHGAVKYNSKASGPIISDPSNAAFWSSDNQSRAIAMIVHMNTVNEDLQKVSKIMAGHKGIETNPYLLEQQIEDFRRIMNNDGKSSVIISEEMAANPDIKRYLKTAEATLEHVRALDPVHRDAMGRVLKRLAVMQGQEQLTANQIKKYTGTMRRFLQSHFMGYNNTPKEEVANILDPKHEESVFVQLGQEVAKLIGKNELESNMLLSQALNVKYEGNRPYISVNPDFFDQSFLAQEGKRLQREFMELPVDLQYKLFIYDLAKNGFNSPKSLLPIMDPFINGGIAEQANVDFQSKDDIQYSVGEIRELEDIIMLRDFNGVRNNIPRFDLGASTHQVQIDMQKHKGFREALLSNTPFYFKARRNGGPLQLYRFAGNTSNVHATAMRLRTDNDRLAELSVPASKRIWLVKTRTPEQLEIDLVTIPSSDAVIFNREKKSPNQGRMGMESRQIRTDIGDIYNDNPDLADIGSKDDYAAYLSTIFPDSEVKDIAYHGTHAGPYDSYDASKSSNGGDFYFTDDHSGASKYVKEINNDPYHQGPDIYMGPYHTRINKVKLNLLDPHYEDISALSYENNNGYDMEPLVEDFGRDFKGNFGWHDDLYRQIVERAKDVGNDGVVLLNTIDTKNEPTKDYIVFDTKDIHILGEKTDMAMFKRFISGDKKGMEAREEFWEYSSEEYLDRGKFDGAMEFSKHQSGASREQAYARYVQEKEKANAIYHEHLKGENLDKWPKKKLQEMYNTYAPKDAYAYSVVTTPIVLALTKKESAEQSALTGRFKGDKDMTATAMWMKSNNVDSEHPEVQAMVRQMLEAEKSFQNEKKKYVQKINEATDALYKEKLGFVFDSYNPINLVKRFYNSYIKDRGTLYRQLYGNLVETVNNTINGKEVKEFKLRTREVVEGMFAKGQISKAEMDFYNVFRETTKELEPFSTQKGKKVRRDYIPHVGMGSFESFSKRGILGLMQNMKSDNEVLKEVMVYVDINGKRELVKYGDIDNFINANSKKEGNKISKLREYIALRRKAKQLAKTGKNEDGSDILISNVEAATVLGMGVMNRFSNSRSAMAAESPSMDLNHALNAYVHATLFTNGNGTFEGFRTLQPMVDGAMALNRDLGFVNTAKYVKLNWKDYFLKGERQVGPMGKRGDQVVDLITKLNLFGRLAFKAQFLIGNVIAGKYHNIKNQSPKEWILGEKRFWGMDAPDVKETGAYGMMSRFKRSQKILQTLNFMDINIYDNVSFSSKGRLDQFFGDLALMPMTWSEKWIQGVQMLGMLTTEQWNKFDMEGNYKRGVEPISNTEITRLENEVKKSQGRGYQAVDQRAVQQYSLGRMFIQFSRFIPTMVADRFDKQDIDIYGKEHIGSMRMVFKTIRDVNSMNPRDYIEYRKKLQQKSPELANRLDSGLKGLALSALIGGYALSSDNRLAEQTFWDANYYADIDKLQFKAIPSAVRGTSTLVESLFK